MRGRREALGLAVKVEDGDAARRAGSAAVCAVLGQLGVLDPSADAGLRDFASPPVRAPRGEPAGEVVATFTVA